MNHILDSDDKSSALNRPYWVPSPYRGVPGHAKIADLKERLIGLQAQARRSLLSAGSSLLRAFSSPVPFRVKMLVPSARF